MLSAFLAAVFPLFAIAAAGFLLSRRTDLLHHPGMPMLATQVAIPALILFSVIKAETPLLQMIHLVGVSAVCVAIGALLVAAGCRLFGVDARFYLSTLVNPNTGNFGIPMIFALFGEAALAPAVIVSTTITLSHFTLGVRAMSGSAHWRQLLTNFPLLALIAGALIVSLDIRLATPLLRLLEMLAGLAQPLMLLLLGGSLANLRLRQRRELGTLTALSVYRPLSGFLIAYAVTRYAGLDALSSTVLMLQMSMPVAVMSYLLTLKYGGPANRIAALTLTSMPVSLLIISLIFAWQYRLS